ncbi:unnamed protein product [Caenorhabditis brenneri]
MLHVDKVDTLLSEKMHISASGLTPFRCYKFLLICHYDHGRLFSYCVIQSDKNGNIDLARDKPIRGTYHEVDPMGLFSTLQLSDEVAHGHYVRNNRAKPFCYTLRLISASDEILDQVTLRKLWLHPSITQIEVAHDKLYGTIFKPPGPGPFSCIIDIPGPSGQLSKGQSAIFSSEGFLVYTMAAFDYKDLPKKMEDVDLEMFSRHIHYIQSLPYCGKIGLYGLSFSGTIVNYLATKHPELSAVVVTNAPEAFYRDLAVMKENGEPIGCEKLNPALEVYINKVKQQKPSFEDAFSKLKPETSIKWKQISQNIPFRVVASLDDWILYGVKNCMNLKKKLLETGHKVEIQLVPGGHAMSVPYFPHMTFAYNKFEKFNLGFGGECCLAVKSQLKVWEGHLRFFRKHLGTPPALPDFEREKEIVLPIGSKL